MKSTKILLKEAEEELTEEMEKIAKKTLLSRKRKLEDAKENVKERQKIYDKVMAMDLTEICEYSGYDYGRNLG